MVLFNYSDLPADIGDLSVCKAEFRAVLYDIYQIIKYVYNNDNIPVL